MFIFPIWFSLSMSLSLSLSVSLILPLLLSLLLISMLCLTLSCFLCLLSLFSVSLSMSLFALVSLCLSRYRFRSILCLFLYRHLIVKHLSQRVAIYLCCVSEAIWRSMGLNISAYLYAILYRRTEEAEEQEKSSHSLGACRVQCRYSWISLILRIQMFPSTLIKTMHK